MYTIAAISIQAFTVGCIVTDRKLGARVLSLHGNEYVGLRMSAFTHMVQERSSGNFKITCNTIGANNRDRETCKYDVKTVCTV
ncbi:hypothetical protein F2P81_001673 [Scophthalmus maximus]|uniref:Uncharacterized protein n=1 Tax=Scophthalmus maximus TaxID=52904 RepID=A0A6A4TPK1_SCOMX|nr:hypothetical protein F2P81_001673 [Scophthalmus maximus]